MIPSWKRRAVTGLGRNTLCVLLLIPFVTCRAGADVPAESSRLDAAVVSTSLVLHKLLDSEWQWRMEQFPEDATEQGDHRYDDRLTDRSAAAVAQRREHHRDLLTALRAIDPASLQGEDRLSWEIAAYFADLAVREDKLLLSMSPGAAPPWSATDSPFSVSQMEGPQFELPMLTRATRFRSEEDYTHYLVRLKAIPRSLEQLEALLELGRKAGVTPAQIALTRLPDQFASLLDPHLDHNPLFTPFLKIPPDIATVKRSELTQSAQKALKEIVVPAVQRFQSYIANVWIPGARHTVAARELPHGEEYYALALERSTTERRMPRELHELGLKEVARLDAEMQAVMKQSGFEGSLAEFRTSLRTDARFQFTSADEELTAYRDLAKQVDAQLPALFAVLPRLPYGVRSMPPEEGNNAPHYVAGALDGSRAGYFEANTNNLASWPRWSIEALFLHEAVPGHHLQIARGQEIPDLPMLRHRSGNYAFTEGWALYAEGLGSQLGLYADPYSWFGRLSLDSLRACRLVVDTGLHSFGWSRSQAIDYLIEHAQLERGFAEAEVDRYIVWPGQATAYKVGEQEILALREQARTQLGARFDIRRFHNAVIDHGPLPLAVLHQAIGAWIEDERKRSGG
jgi:uncharacterized protein (DUF885 family)